MTTDLNSENIKKTCKFNNKMVDNPIKNQAKGIS